MIQLKFYCPCGKLLQHHGGLDGPKVYGNKVEIIVKPCHRCSKELYNRGHIEGEMFRDRVINGLKPKKVKYEQK